MKIQSLLKMWSYLTFDLTLITVNLDILMEFCEHGSIRKYVQDHRTGLFQAVDGNKEMASPQIAEWAFHIASGMQFLSSNGILHIDLAARNILLTHSLVAKIGDFGLSRNLYGREIYQRKQVVCNCFNLLLNNLRTMYS